MSKLNRFFIIKDIKIVDPFAIISVEINYQTHMWRRQIRVNLDQIDRFNYQDLAAQVKKEANILIAKRAPLENNLLRLAKMIGEERQL